MAKRSCGVSAPRLKQFRVVLRLLVGAVHLLLQLGNLIVRLRLHLSAFFLHILCSAELVEGWWLSLRLPHATMDGAPRTHMADSALQLLATRLLLLARLIHCGQCLHVLPLLCSERYYQRASAVTHCARSTHQRSGHWMPLRSSPPAAAQPPPHGRLLRARSPPFQHSAEASRANLRAQA